MNIYYDPKKFGLEPVLEIEYSDRCYQYDTRVVWRRIRDGALLTAHDSGCSCPIPFEQIGLDDLQEVGDGGWIIREMRERARSEFYHGDDIGPHIDKIHALVHRPKEEGK